MLVVFVKVCFGVRQHLPHCQGRFRNAILRRVLTDVLIHCRHDIFFAFQFLLIISARTRSHIPSHLFLFSMCIPMSPPFHSKMMLNVCRWRQSSVRYINTWQVVRWGKVPLTPQASHAVSWPLFLPSYGSPFLSPNLCRIFLALCLAYIKILIPMQNKNISVTYPRLALLLLCDLDSSRSRMRSRSSVSRSRAASSFLSPSSCCVLSLSL